MEKGQAFWGGAGGLGDVTRSVGTVALLVLLLVKEPIYSSCSLLRLLEGLLTTAIKL